MRLLIIGHTSHYLRNGRIVGWGSTVKEIDWLAGAFDEIVHLACLHQGPAPDSALPYSVNNVRLILVPPGGGKSLSDKFRILWLGPLYLWKIIRQLPGADVVHVRCPGGLGLYGMLAASFLRRPKWAKYAGNWVSSWRQTAPSHLFQRWWLRLGLFSGPVTINGRWKQQPSHVYSFLNPSFGVADAHQAEELVSGKRISFPVRIVFVGRTSKAKGLDVALAVVRQLAKYFDSKLLFDVVGGGDEQSIFKRWVTDNALEKIVTFRGWLPHAEVLKLLSQSHFLILPSRSEGWPKVLSESMVYGVVPVASNTSAIPQILSKTRAGIALSPTNIPDYVNAIKHLIENPEEWREMSQAGIHAGPIFSYERYLMAVHELFGMAYNESPIAASFIVDINNRLTSEEIEFSREYWLGPGDRK